MTSTTKGLANQATAAVLPEPCTRERILEVAARLFHEQGYHRTSLQEIANAVGIRKASLYYHIESKQRLLREVLTGCIEPSCRRLAAIQALGDSAANKLHAAVVAHVLDLTANLHPVGIFLREGHSLPPEEVADFMEYRRTYGRLFKLIIQEGVTSGEFRATNADHAALAILGMLNWTAFWYRPDGASTPEQLAEDFATLAVHALVRDHGERARVPRVSAGTAGSS